MSKPDAKLNKSKNEGHGSTIFPTPKVSKGTFVSPINNYIPLAKEATSSDQKHGGPGGVKPGE